MIVIALITSEFSFTKLKGTTKATLAKVIVGVVLGILAIFGTLWGMKLADGTVINVRELASMIAGAAGGPIGGTIAGLIGGLHRYTYGGTTALPCAVSTILIGIIAGMVSTMISGKWYLAKAAVTGFLLESMAMGMILLLVPSAQAFHIVDTIAFSMIGANTIGFIFWVYLSNKLKITPQPQKSTVNGSKVVARNKDIA
jgi:LytS/YehU family sensor histidine kinase